MRHRLIIGTSIAGYLAVACSFEQPGNGDNATKDQERKGTVVGSSRTGQASVRGQSEPVQDTSKAPADRATAIESAKSHLRKWAAKELGVAQDELSTTPNAGKIEGRYSKHDIGALFALEARARGKESLRAFVSENGQLVSLRDRQGFAPLARALGLLDPAVDAEKAAGHVEFLFGLGPRLAIDRSDLRGFVPANFSPPSMKHIKGRAALIFFTWDAGRTGSIVSTRHVLLIDADYRQAELMSEKAR